MTYSLTVSLQASGHEGTVRFVGPSGSITGKCWWEASRIDDGTYPKCSKTTMATVGLTAIFIKGAKVGGVVVNNRFIHWGEGPGNSLGCIAVEAPAINEILGAITPPDAENVTVKLVTA